MKQQFNTWQVLRNKFPEQEYVLISEVSDASGFSRSRSLDFMLINLWQSRGLAITGIERKSNRSDWLKELKTPQKQENHFKYCDYFYLLTDREGVAKIEEIPDSWGWYHINESGVLKTMKQAPKLESVPVHRSLLCAMLRRAACKDNFIHVDSIEDTIKDRVEKLLVDRNRNLEWKSKEYDELLKNVEEFEAASGINVRYGWQLGKVGEAVKAIVNSDVSQYHTNLKRVEEQVKNIYESVSEKVKAINQYVQ